MRHHREKRLESFCDRLGYTFSRPELLQEALTHRSHSAQHNERLEFLGDSVLNCAIAGLFFKRFPQLPEGRLSRFRASMVNQKALAELALRLGMDQLIWLGEGEHKSGGEKRPSILADALEAVFAHMNIDAGGGEIEAFIQIAMLNGVAAAAFEVTAAAVFAGRAGDALGHYCQVNTFSRIAAFALGVGAAVVVANQAVDILLLGKGVAVIRPAVAGMARGTRGPVAFDTDTEVVDAVLLAQRYRFVTLGHVNRIAFPGIV